MEYLNKSEIVEILNSQFYKCKNCNFSKEEAANYIGEIADVCDQIELNSSNYQFAREKQEEFLHYEF